MNLLLNSTHPISTILKVLFLSTLLSLLIKYGAPYVSIPPQDGIAAIVVVLPTIVIALLLGINSQKT